MDDHFDLTSNFIQKKYKLPKIAADKIQQANRFLNDPNSVLKPILQKYRKTDPQQKLINLPKTSRPAHSTRQNTLQQQDLRPEVNLISQKMKKFKPTNGSFSQLYAEQLSIDESRSKRHKQQIDIGLDIPRLNFQNKKGNKANKKNSKIIREKKMLSSRSSDKFAYEKINSQEFPFLHKLKLIRDTSQLLRQNSRNLLDKADSVVTFNQQNYQKLREESNRIITGQQKYVLDQQFSATYRNKVLGGHIRWKSKR